MTWLSSLNGAIAVSIIALMSLVGRSFLDARFVLTEDMPNASKAMVGGWALFTMVLVGGWVWAIVAVAQGSRGGLIAALFVTPVCAKLPPPTEENKAKAAEAAAAEAS